jgi:hypothetical protein
MKFHVDTLVNETEGIKISCNNIIIYNNDRESAELIDTQVANVEKHAAPKAGHVVLRECRRATRAQEVCEHASEDATIPAVPLLRRVRHDLAAPLTRDKRHHRQLVARLVAQVAEQSLEGMKDGERR